MTKRKEEKMKTTRKRTPSTDYFFEALFLKIKDALGSKTASKWNALKLLAFLNWFKDIN